MSAAIGACPRGHPDSPRRTASARKKLFVGDRASVRAQTVTHALGMLAAAAMLDLPGA